MSSSELEDQLCTPPASRLRYTSRVNESGPPESVWFQRWGDPSNTGKFDWHPFGGEITGYAGFDGIDDPVQRTDGVVLRYERWSEGEFFRYEIVGLNRVC